MKSVILSLLAVFNCCVLHCQIIKTYAGAGSCASSSGYCGDGGPATDAQAQLPGCGSFDGTGNYYFCHDGANPHVRKVNTAGIICTVAGTGVQGNTGDGGPATNAEVWLGSVIADSAGNLYLSSNYSNNIRKVDVATGIIHTICGNGTATNTGDGGPATAATITPYGMCFDKHGNLIVGSVGTLRKIDPSGVISYVAGNGTGTFSGDGGPATAAGGLFKNVCLDTSGNIYIGSATRIRKITISTGIITTYAGNGIATYTGDEIPATSAQLREFGIAMDKSNNLYISDDVADRIRMIDPAGIIHCVAGNGTPAYGGDGGQATAASLWNPEGVAIDACGDLYIADDNNGRIRKVFLNPSCTPSLNTQPADNIQSISVYPSPATEYVHIDNVHRGTKMSIRNVQGHTVLLEMLKEENNLVELLSLSSGFYFLELLNKGGEKRNFRLIKL